MRKDRHESRPARPDRARAFRPRREMLEERVVPALDLAATATAPLGVVLGGQNNGEGAGYSVAEVGDVNGDGYDDFVVGAPGITVPGTNGAPFDLNATSRGSVYLVFGSNEVGMTQPVNWANLAAQDRVGDLGALGNTLQNNPLNGTPGFAFNGLTFVTGQNSSARLGTSVTALGDINGDGFADFLIGAPGATDANGANAGTGRAYLVYGGNTLSNRGNKTVDLDNTSANQDLNILTFVNSLPGANTGRGTGLAGDFITDGFQDIAIGAPGASVAGVSNSGAVYVVSGAFLRPARTQTVNLSLVGQGGSTGIAGVLLGGANTGDGLGTSVAGVGNVSGASAGGLQPSALLIGAPAVTAGGRGSAFLVYGGVNVAGLATVTNGISSIRLSGIGTTVPGAVFLGPATGGVTGFSVSAAGDFNNDGVPDFMIGSPGVNSSTGRVDLILGQAGVDTNGRPLINGIIDLSQPQTTLQDIVFTGLNTGDLAGYSESVVASLNNDQIPDILIGAPGVAAGSGAVFLIPGNPGLIGPVILSQATVEVPTIAGQTLTLSQPLTPNFLGTGVAGRPLIANFGNRNTLDTDGIPDFIVGAGGFNLTGSRSSAGAAFALEGTFIPLSVPVSTAITSNISVGTTVAPVYTVNATTPADLTICILSGGSNTPGFQPLVDIDPATLRVNGVAVPNAALTNGGDIDGDGIDDACFTFTPRSLLGLTSATTALTVTARTLSTSTFAGRLYNGTAAIIVTGGGGGGGGGTGLPSGGTAASVFGFQTAPGPYGAQFIPNPATLSKLDYKPLPINVAYNQYLPRGNFRQRLANFYHAKKANTTFSTRTLGHHVFTRGRFPAGKIVKPIVHHSGPTIPPTNAAQRRRILNSGQG